MHDFLAYAAKSFGLLWIMGFFVIVVILTYRPGKRAAYERMARSVLPDTDGEGKE